MRKFVDDCIFCCIQTLHNSYAYLRFLPNGNRHTVACTYIIRMFQEHAHEHICMYIDSMSTTLVLNINL